MPDASQGERAGPPQPRAAELHLSQQRRPREGAGLALAVVREQLHLRGGNIGAENRAGGGARFVLWLPAGAAAGVGGCASARGAS